mgnify:CR=1 FL=1
MTGEIAFTLAVLAVAIALFVWDRLSVDLVALLSLLALTLSGILTASEAMSGFGNSAVVTIGAVFVVSSGLLRTGAADRIGEVFIRFGAGSEARLVLIVMLGVSLISAFIYNAPATAVLMPAVVIAARKSKIAPSKLLIPLSFGSLLGGNLTLIGAAPNLIISHAFEAQGLPPFRIFDPLAMGAIFSLTGIAFMTVVGRHLLPSRDPIQEDSRVTDPDELVALYCLNERWQRLRVLPDSPLVGQSSEGACLGGRYGITLLGVERAGRPPRPARPDERLLADDVLLVQGHDHDIEALAQNYRLEILYEIQNDQQLIGECPLEGLTLAEVALSPRSALEGKTIGELGFRQRYGLEVLGVWRGDRPYRSHLTDFRLQIGDALLLRGPCEQVEQLRRSSDFLVLSGVPTAVQHPEKATLAVLILLASLGMAIAGILPLAVAALLAAVLMVLTGCLSAEEAYRDVNWKILVMLGGILAIGTAMEKTGAALFVATNVIGPVAALGSIPTIAVIFLAAMFLSVTTSNLAAAVIMSPLALNVAANLGCNPRTLLMAVMLGVSTAFVTPFAHQANLVVMGPGNYRFNDYVKVGALLSLVLFLVTLAALPIIWPL